ncbi:class I lanthipeptide [Pedobacter roseus]|jgi:CRISPR/Cas system-associated exonuclease Cas4 (RecB family)|uniref:Class I lanthipeptide n=1 Tax=Pedobacter roseus TaxID=336820 RepID=A0A7G9QDV4_9SPHI|nr:class I lanthipeptide [Pedobacter roseus]QNN41529.1 class I lanthipeptide [Pedobacter roseus]
MKKQLKTKLSLNKETVAKLNEEQMELVSGGQAAADGSTVVIDIPILSAEAVDGGSCGKQSIIASQTCPVSSTCKCSC